MATKVGEMKKLYKRAGWWKKRQGDGDHEVWTNASGEIEIFDGKDSDTIDKGLENKMLKRIGRKKKKK